MLCGYMLETALQSNIRVRYRDWVRVRVRAGVCLKLVHSFLV
jgi:hypothetical protein